MSASPLQLGAEDKLDLLRSLDEFHYWHSLDDERRCKRCRRLITGRQILVFEVDGTRGILRLQCPTVACVSTPGEWVYSDPILAAKLRADLRPGVGSLKKNALSAERTDVPATTRSRRTKRSRHTQPCSAAASTRPSILAPPVPLRALLARLLLLRPIVTALHAIRPVA